MALVLKDRVKEQTTTTGTGTITLGGSISGFESFASVGDGNTTYYAIVNQAADEWEVGIGTYTASGTTLSRDTILESSNSDSAVNFSAGTKDVFVTYPSDKAIYEDAAGGVDINGGTIDGTTIGGSSAAAGTFTTIDFTGADLTASNAAGPALQNEAASSTNPTLVPNRTYLDDGIGLAGDGMLSVALGGAERARFGGAGDRSALELGSGAGTWDSAGLVVNKSGSYTFATDVPNDTAIFLNSQYSASSATHMALRSGNASRQYIYFGDTDDRDVGSLSYDHATDEFKFVAGAAERLAMSSTGLTAADAAGPALLNEAATSTNPTLVPNRADTDTGVGWVSADIGALVAGGVNALQWSSTAELTQAISKDSQLGYTIHNTNAGTAAASRLILGNNSDSQDFFIQLNSSTYSGGLFGSGRHVAYVANVGDHVFYNGRVTGTELMRVSTTQVALPDAAGPALLNEAATSTNPTLVPNKADTDTGVGWVSADIGAAIAGGAEAFRWDSSGSIQLQGNVNFDDSNVLMARDGTSFRMVTNASLPVELRTVDAQPLIFKTTNAERMRIDSSGNLTMGDAAGPALLNEAAGATNPTLIPNRVDLTTGWGSGGAGNLDSVVNGVRATLFNTTTSIFYNSIGVEQGRFDRSSGEMNIGPANTPASLLHVREAGSGVAPQAGTVLTVENSGTTAISILAGAANDAALYFGDSGSALAGQVTYHHATDIMDFGVAASTVFSAAAGSFYAADAAGPALLNEAADSDNPTLVPNRADPDTGLGWVSANKLSLVQGGTNRMVIESTTGATGGSGSAGAGNQYVELNLNGVRYKLLHDGTI